MPLQNKKGQIAIDQIRIIDKKRLVGKPEINEIKKIKNTLKKFLID